MYKIKFFDQYSKMIWFYTLILFIPILRKTIFNRQRELNEYASVDSNNIISIIVIVIMIFIIISHFNIIKNNILSKVNSFTAYYVFAMISFLWADLMNLPFIGFKAIEVIATFLFIGLIFYKINDRIKILNYIILLTTLTALFGMIQFHFSHTNSYSFSSMIGILLYIGGMKYKLLKLKEVWIGLLICILGIFFGTSSGSNVALVLGLLFLFGGGRKGINIIWISIVVVFSYLLYLYFENEIFNIIFPGKNIETIGGMTGRQDMWRMYWSGFLKKPVLGYGYCIGEKNSTIFGWNLDFGANTTAHNMFMSVLINTGLIGLILWVRFLFVLFNRTYKYATLGNKYAALLFPVLIAIVVNANTAPALGSEWSPTGTICYSVVVFALWGLQPIRMLKSWNVKRAKNFNDNIFSKKSIANINI